MAFSSLKQRRFQTYSSSPSSGAGDITLRGHSDGLC